jgi:hypothetical protein
MPKRSARAKLKDQTARFTEMAYYDGQDHPRCPYEATAEDKALLPDIAAGLWVCGLPEGHENFDNPRHRPHSWSQVEAT